MDFTSCRYSKFKQQWVIIKREVPRKRRWLQMLNGIEGLRILTCETIPWNLPNEKFWWPLTYIFSSLKSMESKLASVSKKGKLWRIFYLFIIFSNVNGNPNSFVFHTTLRTLNCYWMSSMLFSRFHWEKDTWTLVHKRKNVLETVCNS